MNEIKNKIEHNEGILREIRNRIMKENWSIIPTSLVIQGFKIFVTGSAKTRHNSARTEIHFIA